MELVDKMEFANFIGIIFDEHLGVYGAVNQNTNVPSECVFRA
jgi:hypothetical protein